MRLLHPAFKGDNQTAMVLSPELEFTFQLKIVVIFLKKTYGCGPHREFGLDQVIIRRDDG